MTIRVCSLLDLDKLNLVLHSVILVTTRPWRGQNTWVPLEAFLRETWTRNRVPSRRRRFQ